MAAHVTKWLWPANKIKKITIIQKLKYIAAESKSPIVIAKLTTKWVPVCTQPWARAQSQVFEGLGKVSKARAVLISGGRRFHQVGTITERASLLGPINWRSFANGTHSMPTLPDWT